MKRIGFILSMVLLILTGCTTKTTQKITQAYEDGKPMIVTTYKIHGDSTIAVKETHYYSDGQLYMEGPLKNEKRDGEWKAYHPGGRLQSIGNFVNGKREGYGITYYENGNVLMEGNYHEGKKNGIWKYYEVTGDLIKEREEPVK